MNYPRPSFRVPPRDDPWYTLVLPVLQEIGAIHLIAQTSDPRSTIYDTLDGRRPTPTRRARLLRLASDYAREQLALWGIDVPRRSDPVQVVSTYLRRVRNPPG